MQAAFFISAKNFSEKQIGILFLVFGLSQFVCMAPAGYFLDYSNKKIHWVIWSGFLTSLLTVTSAITASDKGDNLGLMIVLKVIQGGITAILPPGFNGITLGIVGGSGFTYQVSRNRMMNHIGTALVIAIGSLIAYVLYPNIGALFVVSPLAAIGMYYNLSRIKPTHVDRDAARALIVESPTMTEYEQLDEQSSGTSWHEMDDENEESEASSPWGKNSAFPDYLSEGIPSSYIPPDVLSESMMHPTLAAAPRNSTEKIEASRLQNIQEDNVAGGQLDQPDLELDQEFGGQNEGETTSSKKEHVRRFSSGPSFNFGWGRREEEEVELKEQQLKQDESREKPRQARTPLETLSNPTLAVFTIVVFFFHLANASVLPLVMQSLAVQDAQSGILLSGLCILIGQAFMSYFAKICGDYSPTWGRKNLTFVGLASLTIRCSFLTMLMTAQETVETEAGANVLKLLILLTQILDSIGAGIFGTLHILVTNDISEGTGRFSLMLGVTAGAMCLGATISGYIGQSIAGDYGYPFAFASLGMLSLIPLFLLVVCMPETLPDYVKPKSRRRRLIALLKRLNEHRRRLTMRANPFRRKSPENKTMMKELDPNKQEDIGFEISNIPPKNLELL